MGEPTTAPVACRRCFHSPHQSSLLVHGQEPTHTSRLESMQREDVSGPDTRHRAQRLPPISALSRPQKKQVEQSSIGDLLVSQNPLGFVRMFKRGEHIVPHEACYLSISMFSHEQTEHPLSPADFIKALVLTDDERPVGLNCL